MVTDEIYEHLIYDGVRAASMPVEVPALAETCVVLNGVAKTYAMTGWRVGWMIGPRDVVKAATNLQSHATSNVANVSQRAATAARWWRCWATSRGWTARPRRAPSTPTPRSRACSAGRSAGGCPRPRSS